MYDELIGRLRANGELFVKYIPNAEGEILLQAADAIEELSAIREEQKAQIILMAAEIEELKTYAELYQSLTDKSQKTARNLLDAYPKWIPVTERLPEEKTYVLILFDTIAGKMQGVCFLYKDDDGHNCWTWLDRLGKNLFDIQPTHWMPLPSTDGLNET